MTEAMTNKSMDQTGSNAPYAALITTASGYTYSPTHQYYTSLTNIVGTPQAITSNTVANGTFTGANVTFTAVSGTVVGAIVVYRQNAGANTTWQLVLYEDTGVTGLPVTPNGGNIIISWSGSGIFTLSSVISKCNIRKLVSVGAAEIVAYSYLGENKRRIGLIAEQVEVFAPHAVRKIGGLKHVDYAAAFEAALNA